MSNGRWVTVEQGQSTESIAYEAGHFSETVWNHSNNEALREKRKDSHTLNPGDQLYVPELRLETANRPADQRHRFRRRGVPIHLSVTLRIFNQILANRPYTLTLSRGSRSGVTGPDGRISVPIIPDEPDGTLIVDAGPAGLLEFPLGLRRLDPVTETTGVQGRLRNLSYYRGELHGIFDAATSHALVQFQIDENLEPSGGPDEATRSRLMLKCGC